MKFKTYKKCRISQSFQEKDETYLKNMGSYHTGIDWTCGFGSQVKTDNAGFVYKVYKPFTRDDNWSAVYLLCPVGDDFMEVCFGHLSKVFVEEGQYIPEDYVVGLEGNYGTVFSGGKPVSVKKQKEGVTDGSHVHEQWRPVKEVQKTNPKKHYLRSTDGGFYYDGGYYEIVETNSANGCINPLQYNKTNSIIETIGNIENIINYLRDRFKTLY